MNAKAIPAFWFTVRFAFLLAQQTAFRILQFLQFEGNSGLAAPGWFSILVVVVVVVVVVVGGGIVVGGSG